MGDSQRHYVVKETSYTKGYIPDGSVYVKFQNRLNYSKEKNIRRWLLGREEGTD